MVEEVLRYSAFTDDWRGGNPAGVWIGEALPASDEMQRVANEIGYSETAFIAGTTGRERTVRYFTPQTEVPFCGHATIASGVVLGEASGAGRYLFATPAGEVTVDVSETAGGWRASLTSVTPWQEPISEALLTTVLELLGWKVDELEPGLLPMRIFAGLEHLVLPAATAGRLERLEFDPEALGAVMRAERLDTLQLIWRDDEGVYHSRNPCPGVGIFEDPATGSAAAALGGYLRDQGHLDAPAAITILQGETMGRPSTIAVEIPADGGIVVSGTAVRIPA